jgi:hypothetical protein
MQLSYAWLAIVTDIARQMAAVSLAVDASTYPSDHFHLRARSL